MDIKPQQPISDDQELAKVLAGITAGADNTTPGNLADDLDQEAATGDVANAAPSPASIPAPDPVINMINPSSDTTTSPAEPAFAMPPIPVANNGLEAIKHDALNELRPLVDKLNLSAEEKFDTYLLLIRSTDDATLVAPAFEAARSITDEAGKAQALLDIVKEIDYLSNPQKPIA